MEDSSSHELSLIHSFVAPDPFSTNNFLQHVTADDVILRVFEFLECHSLIRKALTSSRFQQLAYRSATQRTYNVANSRQLNSVMELLRAKEQIDGIGTGMHDSHVRVPILLLNRRVLVTNAGDPEINGIYFCTGSNGNGFVFTKPQLPEQRVRRRNEPILSNELPIIVREWRVQRANQQDELVNASHHQAMNVEVAPGEPIPIDQGPTGRFESEVAQPGQLLRCIIAKRFSNETILWYLSKGVEATEARDGVQKVEVFSYWAKLMVIEDTSPDICRYPSQSSILARLNEGWQGLYTTGSMRSPTIELLD